MVQEQGGLCILKGKMQTVADWRGVAGGAQLGMQKVLYLIGFFQFKAWQLGLVRRVDAIFSMRCCPCERSALQVRIRKHRFAWQCNCSVAYLGTVSVVLHQFQVWKAWQVSRKGPMMI
jgi:hypothetical protein